MSRATTIGAGTAEIHRNTIAETVLGLPSHRGEGTRRAAVTPGAPLALSDASEIELREVLAKALQSRVDVEVLLSPTYSSNGAGSAVWSALTEFGLPGLAVDESLGGADAPPRLLYAAIEETARAFAPVPLVPTVIALDVAVAAGATGVAERIVSGAAAAFVVPLDDDGWITGGIQLPVWDGSRLTGFVPLVAGAPAAEVLLVLARQDSGGGRGARRGGPPRRLGDLDRASAARHHDNHRGGDVRWYRWGGRRVREHTATRAAGRAAPRAAGDRCGLGGRRGPRTEHRRGLGDGA